MHLESDSKQPRSSFRFLLCTICECIIFPLMCTGLVALFLYYFKAEGFSRLLLGWTALSSLLLFISYRVQTKHAAIRITAKVLALLSIACGAIALLIQLGATQRSLTEAWLELARQGEGFGFFSFFAAEIFAFLLIISVRILAMRQYVSGMCAIAAVCLLCWGIIGGQQLPLIAAALFIVVPVLCKKWKTFLTPAVCAAVIACMCAGMSSTSDGSLYSLFSFDSSQIMMHIAPDFPLMVHIPGYGYSVKAHKPVNSVSLSTRTLFQVFGYPNETHYFVTERFTSWTGKSWLQDQKETRTPDIELYFSRDEVPSLTATEQKIQLELFDDFFSIIPCTDNTTAALLPEVFRDSNIISNYDSTLEPTGGLRRGDKLVLYIQRGARAETDAFAELRPDRCTITLEESKIPTFSEIPPSVRELASSLMEQAILTAEKDGTAQAAADAAQNEAVSQDNSLSAVESTPPSYIQRAYITQVLNYLKDGFTYSLKTTAAPQNKDPLEYFLFESKKGFCTWFAGAFTLLMHAEHIPARIVEGYRTALNENGQGIITGMSAHAWSEIFIDGQWRIFEPTPVYTTEDPFRYINEKDKYTREQISLMFNTDIMNTQSDTERHSLPAFFKTHVIVAAFVVVVVLAVAFFLFVYKKPEKRIVRHARRFVKKYKRLHIASPVQTGWLAWKKAVAASAKTEQERKTAAEATQTADQMIELLYSHARIKQV